MDDFWAESTEVYVVAITALRVLIIDPTIYLLGEDGMS